MPGILHLTASRFFGGPERQMLELAKSLPSSFESVFASFYEEGLCDAFLDQARQHGFDAVALKHDTPRLAAAWRELVGLLRSSRAEILCCHGYKANLVGRLAALWVGIPAIAVSRGWTGETFRVRLYEALDRLVLRWMNKVVCVSKAQQEKVHRGGVPDHKTTVIWNAIRPERFAAPKDEYCLRLQGLFPEPPDKIVGAAGRLSPEKGFHVLVDAAAEVVGNDPSVGFVLFGEGRLRDSLASRIQQKGLESRFILAGFRSDLDQYLPHLDLLVLPSFSEGLPNVALEAFAAGVPVVATRVGGSPEVVEEGISGYLVPPGNSAALAQRVRDVLSNGARREMGLRGRQRVNECFSFASQAMAYRSLFQSLVQPAANPAHANEIE